MEKEQFKELVSSAEEMVDVAKGLRKPGRVTHVCDGRFYRAEWSEENGVFVGLCDDDPSLSWLASSPEEALSEIKRLIVEAKD